jgi:hypothetical protein
MGNHADIRSNVEEGGITNTTVTTTAGTNTTGTTTTGTTTTGTTTATVNECVTKPKIFHYGLITLYKDHLVEIYKKFSQTFNGRIEASIESDTLHCVITSEACIDSISNRDRVYTNLIIKGLRNDNSISVELKLLENNAELINYEQNNNMDAFINNLDRHLKSRQPKILNLMAHKYENFALILLIPIIIGIGILILAASNIVFLIPGAIISFLIGWFIINTFKSVIYLHEKRYVVIRLDKISLYRYIKDLIRDNNDILMFIIALVTLILTAVGIIIMVVMPR